MSSGFLQEFLVEFGSHTDLQTKSLTESTGVASSDSVNLNREQELNIPGLLLAFRQDWTFNLEAYGTNAYDHYVGQFRVNIWDL